MMWEIVLPLIDLIPAKYILLSEPIDAHNGKAFGKYFQHLWTIWQHFHLRIFLFKLPLWDAKYLLVHFLISA